MGQRIAIEPIVLTDEQFASLNEKFPASFRGSNSVTGERAKKLAMIFLADLYPGCRFVDHAPGADLALLDPCINVAEPMQFEVKGTNAQTLKISNIVSSSSASGNLLENEGVPILRITGVFDRNPGIAVLVHGEDFVLKFEYRKRAKPI